MVDVVSVEKRSWMMSGIRAKDTRPEMIVRRLLHKTGFRFRLHHAQLPGKPDLVLKRWRAVVHVHGCFWHWHDCLLFRLPATDTEKWTLKLAANRRRDAKVAAELKQLGWRQLIIWECAVKGRTRLAEPALLVAMSTWLRSGEPDGEVRGVQPGAVVIDPHVIPGFHRA